jgi:ring-1,2-phenylacetyl-CoA epoxidase subunit PaaE
MFLDDLLALQKAYPEHLFLESIYSRTQAEGATFGRIERSTINYLMKNKYAGVDFAQFLLCGPEEMIYHAKEVLLENKIKENRISFELFHSTEEGEDVAKEGFSEIEVRVDDESYNFSMNQQDVILDAALNEDIDAPYSCQGGICSSCVAKVVEGTAKMRKNQILTDEEVEEGLILTCQAHPTSSRIVVDYDDV